MRLCARYQTGDDELDDTASWHNPIHRGNEATSHPPSGDSPFPNLSPVFRLTHSCKSFCDFSGFPDFAGPEANRLDRPKSIPDTVAL